MKNKLDRFEQMAELLKITAGTLRLCAREFKSLGMTVQAATCQANLSMCLALVKAVGGMGGVGGKKVKP